jgi:DUF4097 and DUF4098 domain-containing protein YvlB
MTHTNKIIWLTAFSIALTAGAFSQPVAQKIPIPLSDPNRPAFLKVGLLSGSIHVKGGAAKEVVIEATKAKDDEEEEHGKKSSGMKLIPNTSLGLSAEEENNTVTVSTGLRGNSHTVDLVIQVPTACSMKLSTINDGDIVVDNVTGDLEINNTNGSISLQHISGSAVAKTINGEVRAVFTEVNPEKAMSFSSLNGDIDVTLPPSVKASVQLKSDQGDIYSDFVVHMENSPAKVEKNEQGKGKYRVTVEKTMRGTINGGGQEIQFTNFNGDIYIRKGS